MVLRHIPSFCKASLCYSLEPSNQKGSHDTFLHFSVSCRVLPKTELLLMHIVTWVWDPSPTSYLLNLAPLGENLHFVTDY